MLIAVDSLVQDAFSANPVYRQNVTGATGSLSVVVVCIPYNTTMNEESGDQSLANRVRVINWPGEGLVVELESDLGSRMFTLEGLQWQIMDLEKRGKDATLEQTALSMLSAALETTHGNSGYREG